MTDTAPLLSRLTTLVAQPRFTDDGARIIGGRGAMPAMTAILREIDTTVLARKLNFQLAEAKVSVFAAHRRLRGLASAQKAGDLVGRVLAPEDEKTISALGAYLKGICAGDPLVTVRSEPAEDFGEQIDAGITVAQLADAWGIDINVAIAPPVERFLGANAGMIPAAIYCAPSGAQRDHGDAERLRTIWEERVRPLRDAHTAALRAASGPMLLSLDGEGGSGERISLATAGAEACLFAHAETDLNALIESWTAVAQV